MRWLEVNVLISEPLRIDLTENAVEDVYTALKENEFIESVDSVLNGNEVVAFLVGTEVLTHEDVTEQVSSVLGLHYAGGFSVL